MLSYPGLLGQMGISPLNLCILVVIMIWSTIWKGLALWKSSKKGSIVWFIVLLLVNTVGILDILYIYVFSECCKKKEKQPKKRRR
ncbi:Uncharacterised protein [uncultured archaeon]|nr:Uncharacterised protein [uncultured archaeon]